MPGTKSSGDVKRFDVSRLPEEGVFSHSINYPEPGGISLGFDGRRLDERK